MHPLWFDAEKHPDKQDLFEEMIKDEMEAVRKGKNNAKLRTMPVPCYRVNATNVAKRPMYLTL